MKHKTFPKNVLIIYKKSTYEIYFSKNAIIKSKSTLKKPKGGLKAFENSHHFHYKTLQHVQAILDARNIRYCSADRRRKMDYAPYDLIITVGGDGTLLSAAGCVSKQKVLGVNSNPSVSVGRFCSANITNFEAIFDAILKNNYAICSLNRINLVLNGKATDLYVLNDILICHANPAAMSHYILELNGDKEAQRSSGIWIATQAGSTGAVQSAWGKPIDIDANQIVFKARELYRGKKIVYKHEGAILDGDVGFRIHSTMENGMLYVDGSRVQLPFCHGDIAALKNSKIPLKLIDFEGHLAAAHLKTTPL
ncbi:MAG: NAD+ kinase [Candidatus Omnitrophota bacterium]|jgi:NAD+ kinase